MSQPDDRSPSRIRGSYALSDVATPTIAVACRRCARHGSYRVDRLMAEHGDLPLPDLLRRLGASCRAADNTGRCSIGYDPLPPFA